MKDTFKNSIIGALALFGLFAIISGANSKNYYSENVSVDNLKFEMHKMEDGKVMVFNKENGELEYKKVDGEFYDAVYQLQITGESSRPIYIRQK